jgi:hypothetical protein
MARRQLLIGVCGERKGLARDSFAGRGAWKRFPDRPRIASRCGG